MASEVGARLPADPFAASVTASATQFRSALETMPRADLISMSDFPRGSCGDAAMLLGEYLFDSGLGEWTYVSAFLPDTNGSHAWIELDGLVADITADQFPGIDDAVVVARSSEFHRKMEPVETHAARLHYYDEYTYLTLVAMYERVLHSL